MPSPDVVAYFGLELTTLDEQTLVDTALANAVEEFPDWTPREGNTEVVLIEQLAALVSNLGYVINELPNGMTEVLLRLFKVDRDPGQPPVAEVIFTVSDTLGHTIPVGTVVRLDLGDNVDPLDFLTDVALVIAPGSSTGTVVATANTATPAANGVTTGLDLLDAIAYVDTVALAGPVTGGTDADTQETFLARAAPVLARLTSTLVRPADVTTFIAALNPLAARVKVLDLWDGTGPSAPGDDPGYLTVAVSGTGGAPLSTAVKANIRTQVAGRMHAGLTVTVRDADLHEVSVAVTVTRLAAAVSADVEAAVEAALAAYLNPDVWPWASVILVNELIPVVDAAAGVDTVESITVTVHYPGGTPADATFVDVDADLEGYSPLVSLTTAAVTVEAP